MTYITDRFTVTTWRRPPEGDWTWRVRHEDRFAEFAAPADIELADLFELAEAALAVAA